MQTTCSSSYREITTPKPHYSIFTGWMFLTPSQQCQSTEKVKKVVHARLPSIGFQSWSRFLADSLRVTWVINPAVGCHYTFRQACSYPRNQWCIGGYTRVYGVYQPLGFFWQRIFTSAIINKQGTFRPFATPVCVYPPPFLAIHHCSQPLCGLLPILLLGEQRHDGCEQFA